jgi:hypothetical protein
MITFVLMMSLAQATAAPVAPPAATTVPVATVPVAGTDSEAPADAQQETLAERQERIGCVVKTGTRIKRKDRDNCINGQSLSREAIERNGGRIAGPSNTAVPAKVGD